MRAGLAEQAYLRQIENETEYEIDRRIKKCETGGPITVTSKNSLEPMYSKRKAG